MKTQLTLLCVLLTLTLYAQKHITKNGETHFTASVETFEPVEAKNTSSTVVLNTESGQMAVLLFVKAFHFDIALMEEHFNENYMDSDQYPKATFRGQITNFDSSILNKEKTQFTLEGQLSIRGKEKKIQTPIFISKANNSISLTYSFKVSPEEFGIEIPGIVRKKIAKDILIEGDYVLNPKN